MCSTNHTSSMVTSLRRCNKDSGGAAWELQGLQIVACLDVSAISESTCVRFKDISEDVQSYKRGVSSCCIGRGLRGVRTCEGAVSSSGAASGGQQGSIRQRGRGGQQQVLGSKQVRGSKQARARERGQQESKKMAGSSGKQAGRGSQQAAGKRWGAAGRGEQASGQGASERAGSKRQWAASKQRWAASEQGESCRGQQASGGGEQGKGGGVCWGVRKPVEAALVVEGAGWRPWRRFREQEEVKQNLKNVNLHKKLTATVTVKQSVTG